MLHQDTAQVLEAELHQRWEGFGLYTSWEQNALHFCSVELSPKELQPDFPYLTFLYRPSRTLLHNSNHSLKMQSYSYLFRSVNELNGAYLQLILE